MVARYIAGIFVLGDFLHQFQNLENQNQINIITNHRYSRSRIRHNIIVTMCIYCYIGARILRSLYIHAYTNA